MLIIEDQEPYVISERTDLQEGIESYLISKEREDLNRRDI
jgi:hypothetical protein